MTYVSGFAPIEGESASILILGTMPGIASLTAGQYYAHPRNAFWKIISTFIGCSAGAPYEARVDLLKRSHIVLWDVLESCVRPGSMDASINKHSIKPNNISALLERQPGITTICFNGSEAEKLFKKHIAPMLKDKCFRYLQLPSTSPAYAAMSFEEKAMIWRSAICTPPFKTA